MRLLSRKLRFLNKPLIFMLMLAMLPISVAPASATAEGNCLDLNGTILNSNHEVRMNEPLAMEYTITPSGTYTETVSRDPVEVSLVLDVSGSMNEEMLPYKTNPTRLEAMKTATGSLLNELKALNQVRSAKDKVALFKFSNLASQLQGLTSNYDDIQKKITALASGGNTNIEDGLRYGVNLLLGSGSLNKKYIILLTDGAATAYRDNMKSSGYTTNEAEAKKRALQRADEIALKGIPVFTIALGYPGTTTIDHNLLDTISSKTGGIKYNASNSAELTQVFSNITQEMDKSGQISSILIKQNLPAGFTLAEGNPSNISLNNGTVTITLPSIQYPYAANATQKVTLMLKQINSTGEFDFEDADLSYLNACTQSVAKKIANPNIVKVTGWLDRWGNLYTAESDGSVNRYKHGIIAQKQFTVPGNGKAVMDITFKDSATTIDDDAIVVVEYIDASKVQWDLRPSAPVIVLKDVNGVVINDTKWQLGKAKIQVSGGIPTGTGGLPSNTNFAGSNGDFSSSYLASHEYKINTGTAKGLPIADTKVIDEVGRNINIEARALTTSISGLAANPSRGLAANRTVSLTLDATPPAITYDVVKSSTTDTDPTIKVTATDLESEVVSITVTIDGKPPKKETFTAMNTATWEFSLSEFIPDEEERKGWKKITIVAMNEVDREGTHVDYFVVNPGPSGKLVPNMDTTLSATNKPVTVSLVKDGTVNAKFDRVIVPAQSGCSTCEEIRVSVIEYKVDTYDFAAKQWVEGVYKKLGADKFQITRAGSSKVTVKFTDNTDELNEYTTNPILININYDQKRY